MSFVDGHVVMLKPVDERLVAARIGEEVKEFLDVRMGGKGGKRKGLAVAGLAEHENGWRGKAGVARCVGHEVSFGVWWRSSLLIS